MYTSMSGGCGRTWAAAAGRRARGALRFRRYTGEWLGNVRDGRGVQLWADSARYEGQWVQELNSLVSLCIYVYTYIYICIYIYMYIYIYIYIYV